MTIALFRFRQRSYEIGINDLPRPPSFPKFPHRCPLRNIGWLDRFAYLTTSYVHSNVTIHIRPIITSTNSIDGFVVTTMAARWRNMTIFHHLVSSTCRDDNTPGRNIPKASSTFFTVLIQNRIFDAELWEFGFVGHHPFNEGVGRRKRMNV